MEKAKELALAFNLADELVDRFDIPPKGARWGPERRRLNIENEHENNELDSEYV